MAYSVTALVRRALLPRSLRCRPTAKLCLLALADRCDDHGEGAWPSLATIAAEAEVDDVRTVRTRLASLQALGLIAEQAAPTRQRPRTWRLDLAALAALARNRLPLFDPGGAQAVAPLTFAQGGKFEVEGGKSTTRGANLIRGGGQVHAYDPVLDPVLLNSPLNARAIDKPQGYGGDLAAARDVLRHQLGIAGVERPMTDVLTAAAAECAARGIDLGDESDHVLQRAYLIEHVRAKFAIQPQATIRAARARARVPR